MSKRQKSGQPAKQRGGENGLDRWRQALNLGGQLLTPLYGALPDEQTLRAYQDKVTAIAEDLLDAQAELWLSEAFSPLNSGNEPDGPGGQGFPQGLSNASMRRAWQTRQTCCTTDLEKEERQACEDCQAQDVIGLAAPLLIQDAETGLQIVMGVLYAARPEGPSFSEFDKILFENLATQAATALQMARQTVLERWRVEQLSLVRQVSAQIADLRDLDEIARKVTQLILHTFQFYFVAIFTLEPDEDVLHFRASAGPIQLSGEPVVRFEGYPEGYFPALAIHMGEGIIGHVAESGEEFLASDVSREPRYRYSDVLPGTRSEVALPLKIQDRVVGVMDVQSDQVDDFHETDLIVLRALAGNIAIAINGAHLYNALRHRAEQLSTLFEVSNAITSILDLEALLKEVVSFIQKRFGFPFVHIFDVHPGRRKIFYLAGSGDLAHTLLEEGFAYDLDDPEGIIPWVARHGETVLANNVDREPRYRSSVLPPANTRAELAVPLIFAGQVLGVLDIQSDRQNVFEEADRFLFEALADNIAVAMRNANLYRSELWRRQVADSMREVAGLLSADADLDQVLEATLTELDRALPCDVAAIWLLEGEGLESNSESGRSNLHLAAVHGIDLSLYDMAGEIPIHDQEGKPASWLVAALYADEPVVRSPQQAPDPLATVLGYPPDYSAIATPLRVGGQRLGVLTLAHQAPGRYGTEARAMTATFAGYAAIAIENTRLYEAAHEQAWVSTVLLQVAEATQSLTNLNELLATVVRITPMLIGVKACALYMLDDNQVFVPAAAYGFNREQQTEFERWRFAPGDVPAFDRLLERKSPIILYGESSDPLISNILLSGPDTDDRLFETELLVLVPLVARGEVIGALLIDYSNDQVGDSSLEAIEVLFDERLAIIQGIAHQTATAVENIRLLKSQKEEAYVSVALLQVAQAVVSSNDLDETLGAIVRITPILVGVKRAIIFLWDSETKTFRLAQAYGLTRDGSERAYAPGEFPLLDVVRAWDSLVVYPLEAAQPEPAEPLEAWTGLLPPEPEEVDEYLEEEECLLLAFPLSIKGNVLGVLLVEEPGPVMTESFSGGSFRRLREKRLEITTGISQQAALAIQNDQLQREMVESERLEREFQLAREIQRAFLPQTTPHLPGWDLQVLWRTAHEVGGDFYDFFELPGNRLGLVIADVADKGMPAALFMTLIRTLVRANVQELTSPAAVLKRVNDILVPDAQQGMFVTIIYAVLDQKKGKLTYANAGHNPPLWLEAKNGEVHPLTKSAMALGVEEGTQVEERQITLHPGDFLIFYTDGLTEAFSGEGEMYGEEHLIWAVQNTQFGERADDFSARDMLQAIDASLRSFSGNVSLADDLTLMVLKRLSKHAKKGEERLAAGPEKPI